MEDRPTVVLGASTNPERYAFRAIHRLTAHGHSVHPVGVKKGEVAGVAIQREMPTRGIHTVTLYLGPVLQKEWHERILELKPERIIFNPGTEDPAFEQRAEQMGIEVVEGCTLVMLASGQY